MTQELTIDMVPRLPLEVHVAPHTSEKIAAVVCAATALAAISCQADYESAEKSLKEVTALSNQIDKQRLSFCAPLTALAKSAKSVSDAARKPLEDAKDALKRLMAAYIERCRREQEEALSAAVAEQERREREAKEILAQAAKNPFAAAIAETISETVAALPPVAIEVAKPVQTRGSAILEKWLWAVEDQALIPKEFFVLDDKRISALVREHKGSLTIPGIRVFAETSVRAR